MDIGEWVAVSEDGLWVDCVTDATSFKSKKEAIDSVASAKLDPATRLKVKRISAGAYQYIPKNCDTLRYEYNSAYDIVKLTSENIEHYKELEEQLDDQDE